MKKIIVLAILAVMLCAGSVQAARFTSPPEPATAEYYVILHSVYLADLQRDVNIYRGLGWEIKGEMKEVRGEATQVIVWPAEQGIPAYP